MALGQLVAASEWNGEASLVGASASPNAATAYMTSLGNMGSKLAATYNNAGSVGGLR